MIARNGVQSKSGNATIRKNQSSSLVKPKPVVKSAPPSTGKSRKETSPWPTQRRQFVGTKQGANSRSGKKSETSGLFGSLAKSPFGKTLKAVGGMSPMGMMAKGALKTAGMIGNALSKTPAGEKEAKSPAEKAIANSSTGQAIREQIGGGKGTIGDVASGVLKTAKMAGNALLNSPIGQGGQKPTDNGKGKPATPASGMLKTAKMTGNALAESPMGQAVQNEIKEKGLFGALASGVSKATKMAGNALANSEMGQEVQKQVEEKGVFGTIASGVSKLGGLGMLGSAVAKSPMGQTVQKEVEEKGLFGALKSGASKAAGMLGNVIAPKPEGKAQATPAEKKEDKEEKKGGFWSSLKKEAFGFAEGFKDSVVGTVKDTIGMAKGVMDWTKAAAVCLTTPKDKRPEWAVEGVKAPVEALKGIKDGIVSIVQDPVGVVKGIGQMVKQTVEEKGVGYLIGRAAPEILGTVLGGGAVKGGMSVLKAGTKAAKVVDKVDDVVDGVKAVKKAGLITQSADKVDDVMDVVKATQKATKAGKAADKVDDVASVMKVTKKTGAVPEAADKVADVAKTTKTLKTADKTTDGIQATQKAADKLEDAKDVLKSADKATDGMVDAKKTAKAMDKVDDGALATKGTTGIEAELKTGAFNSNTISKHEGIGRFENLEINPTDKGLDLLKDHLQANGFDNFTPNQQMIARIESHIKDGKKLTGADANFYMHEIKERTLMRKGASLDDAHNTALDTYKASQYSVYHPDVVLNNQKLLASPKWSEFWDSQRLIPGQTGVITGGSSTKLGENMMAQMGQQGKKWTGHQAQHIMPTQTRKHPIMQKIGMDLDHESNGIFLREPGFTPISTMSRHKGYHSIYNKFVQSKLDAMDINLSAYTLQQQTLELQSNLKKLLESGVPIYKNKKRKMGGSFDLLERSYERLLNKGK